MSDASSANALWGGRFAGGPSAIMARINVSIGFDRKLFRQDLKGSRAHADMLHAVGLLTADDLAAIQRGLTQIEEEISAGRFVFKDEHEDIHMNIEARLREIIGEPAGRLHTARSRNDQVALDMKLWTRDACDQIDGDLQALQRALITTAEAHADAILPGLTHLQPAQPVTFGHHLLAYVEMFGRDRSRFADCRRRLNESPLGAAALAGTPYAIDRRMTATALGFDRPMANSMDAVASRDHVQEFLAAATITGTHLSRFAEEIVLWMSNQYRFIRLSDAFTTGSSIMPQKKNPDAAELVRAKVGRLLGAFSSLTVMLKGLALTYSKDMQDDKEPAFEAMETLSLCLAATTGMVGDLTVDRAAMRRAAEGGFITATDLADYLVLELGLPFREAHHITGALVKRAEDLGVGLADLSDAELAAGHPRLTGAARAWLTVEGSVARRSSEGGTAPTQVRHQIARAKDRFL